MDAQVLEAMEPYFSEEFFNPSATYLTGQAVRQVVNEARARIAVRLGCRPAEIIFTAGATEANNLAIQGVMKNFPDGEVLTSAIDHDSVLEPAKLFDHQILPVDQKGIVDLAVLKKMISGKTVLVSVGYVNNELGAIQHLSEIARLLAKVRAERLAAGNKKPILLHSDAAQAGNFLDLHTARLGVDLMSINGGKIYGPKQSGALYVKAGIRLQPLIVGGGQEFGLRAGTENVSATVGLAEALDLAQARRAEETKRLSALRQKFENGLLEQLPNVRINGSPTRRAPHIISVTFPGVDNERLMMQLDENGIICAVGSACSAALSEPSHVLSAIGLPDIDARSTLRFSFGRATTETDIDQTLKTLQKLLTA